MKDTFARGMPVVFEVRITDSRVSSWSNKVLGLKWTSLSSEGSPLFWNFYRFAVPNQTVPGEDRFMQDTHEKHPELPIEEAGQSGFSGFYERLLRRFPEFTHGLTLVPIYLFASFLLGLAVSVGVLAAERIPECLGPSVFSRGVGIGFGFFSSGFTLLLLVPLVARGLRPFVRPGRGQSHSNRFIPWYLFNSLAYLVRYTFLEFITPTPFNLWYFRAMGMKVGRKVVINSSNITDAPLITLEDGVTIGGSAVILAHYGMSGYLILAPVVIRKNAVIGLHSKIMAGVEIGEGAKIMPGSVVMPKTVVPAGEIWGGVPAVRVAPSKAE